MLLRVTNNGLAHGGNALGECVAGLGIVELGGGCQYGVDGCLSLGFTATQVNDGLPLLSQNARPLIQSQRWRGWNRAGELTGAQSLPLCVDCI